MKRQKDCLTRLMNFFRRNIWDCGLWISDYDNINWEGGTLSSHRLTHHRSLHSLLPLFLFLTLLFLSILNPVPASAEKVILKIGTLAPEGSTWVKTFRDINQELGQKTGDQVAIRIFPGGVLGDEEDMLRKIKVGPDSGRVLYRRRTGTDL